MYLHGFDEKEVTKGDVIAQSNNKKYAVAEWVKLKKGYKLQGVNNISFICKNDIEVTVAAKKLRILFFIKHGIPEPLESVFNVEICTTLKLSGIETINDVCVNYEQYIEVMFDSNLKALVAFNDMRKKMKEYFLEFRA